MSRGGSKLLDDEHTICFNDPSIVDFKRMDARFRRAMLRAINNHSEGDGGWDDYVIIKETSR